MRNCCKYAKSIRLIKRSTNRLMTLVKTFSNLLSNLFGLNRIGGSILYNYIKWSCRRRHHRCIAYFEGRSIIASEWTTIGRLTGNNWTLVVIKQPSISVILWMAKDRLSVLARYRPDIYLLGYTEHINFLSRLLCWSNYRSRTTYFVAWYCSMDIGI